MKAGEHGLKAKADDEKIKDLRAKVDELVLELDARKNGKLSTAGTRRPSDVAEQNASRRQQGVDRQAVPVADVPRLWCPLGFRTAQAANFC